jgi:hypothetical protein
VEDIMKLSSAVLAVAASGSLLCAAGTFPAAAQDVRQLPPHVHGASDLTIAVEGKKLSITLHSPGNDIVGFEYAPSTDAQRAAVAAATNLLKDPLSLLGVPAAAQCAVTKTETVLAEEEDDEDIAAPAPAAPAGPAAPRHSEFQNTYELTCGNVPAITGLNFAFFQKFPNAQTVHVDLVTGKGAFSFDVPRANPMVSTRNMF